VQQESRQLELAKKALNAFYDGSDAEGDEHAFTTNTHDVPHLGSKKMRRVPATTAQKHKHRVLEEADESRQDRREHNKLQVMTKCETVGDIELILRPQT
jgi:hypothetical protein